MNWAIPRAARTAHGKRVEAGLGIELSRQQRGRDVPPAGGARDRLDVSGRHEGWHRAAAVRHGRGRTRVETVPPVPRLPRVALKEVEPAGVTPEPRVGGRRPHVEL